MTLAPDGTQHQWLHKIDEDGVLHVHDIEMTAVLKCAATLADKEGMSRTAARLRNDAWLVEQLLAGHGKVVIHVA